MVTLTVVPAPLASVPVPSGLALYALEEQLCAMAETVDLVPADREQQLLRDFQAALVAAVEERDHVGQFVAHLEQQAAFADAEIKRLRERKQFFERVLEKVEQYVIYVIESLGPDAKGKPRKLEGNTVTFSVRRCPSSVEVQNEAVVPGAYKSVTVTLPLPLWEEVLDSLVIELGAKVLDAVRKPAVTISKSAVKASLDAGAAIPGASLVTNKKSLVRK